MKFRNSEKVMKKSGNFDRNLKFYFFFSLLVRLFHEKMLSMATITHTLEEALQFASGKLWKYQGKIRESHNPKKES